MPRTFPLLEFQNISRLNPYYSSWVCFCEAIEGRKNISNKIVKKYFYKLVDRDDYAKGERRELLNFLFSLRDSGRR